MKISIVVRQVELILKKTTDRICDIGLVQTQNNVFFHWSGSAIQHLSLAAWAVLCQSVLVFFGSYRASRRADYDRRVVVAAFSRLLLSVDVIGRQVKLHSFPDIECRTRA